MAVTRTSPKRRKAQTTRTHAAMARANRRAVRLVEMLLQRLEEGVRSENELGTPQWRRLFGSTQSAVVNLQKLVAALGDLPPVPPEDKTDALLAEAPMTRDELQMMREWLNLSEGEPSQVSESLESSGIPARATAVDDSASV